MFRRVLFNVDVLFFSSPRRTEEHLRYQSDREIDFVHFLETRIGGALKKGLEIAGRDVRLFLSCSFFLKRCADLLSPFQFTFLGYSNSSLKDHASVPDLFFFFSPVLSFRRPSFSAWFVTPFVENGRTVNASTIRAEMGSFEVESYYPARLGARMA